MTGAAVRVAWRSKRYFAEQEALVLDLRRSRRLGIKEAQRAQGDATGAAATQWQLDAVWEGDSRKITRLVL